MDARQVHLAREQVGEDQDETERKNRRSGTRKGLSNSGTQAVKSQCSRCSVQYQEVETLHEQIARQAAQTRELIRKIDGLEEELHHQRISHHGFEQDKARQRREADRRLKHLDE